MDMVELVEFLNARLDEDEEIARWIIEHGCWDGVRVESANAQEAQHIARHGPARVLADVAAERQIVEFLGNPDAPEGEGKYVASCTLLLLALPYHDHPDYRAIE